MNYFKPTTGTLFGHIPDLPFDSRKAAEIETDRRKVERAFRELVFRIALGGPTISLQCTCSKQMKVGAEIRGHKFLSSTRLVN